MSVITVAGATGYIGGRLVPLLLEAHHEVRVFDSHSTKAPGCALSRPGGDHGGLHRGSAEGTESGSLSRHCVLPGALHVRGQTRVRQF
ncbi:MULTISPECIES: NAD-dependent epimerase/dehydratase family protein [Arthrobacter]|uniref:NAD-dependent epimerase/dehydratase family protein n=1 Tax=Arthrobacter TaxID=1663 RepID=UPI000A4C664F